MHLKELSLRIDQQDAAHADLNSHIRTYIQQAEDLEQMLTTASIGRQDMNKQEEEELTNKLEKANQEIDGLTASIIKKKLNGFSIAEQKTQLAGALKSYTQSIYNPLIQELNQIIMCKYQNPTLKLSTIEASESTDIYESLSQNRKIIAEDIERLANASKQLNIQKEAITIEIANTFEKREDCLFRARNKRYEATSRILGKIESGEKETQLLTAKIK